MDFLVTTGKQCLFWGIVYSFGYWQWDLRWLALIVGFGGIVYIWRHQRSKKKVTSGGTSGEFQRVTDQLPSWVLNQDSERSEWTNIIFHQLWPHLESFLKQTLSTVINHYFAFIREVIVRWKCSF